MNLAQDPERVMREKAFNNISLETLRLVTYDEIKR